MTDALVPAANVLPTDTVFGAPPLIEGEDAAAYADLLARVCASVKPADILEEIWVRDVVDLVWEALRLRRLRTHLVTSALHSGVRDVVGPLVGWDHANAIEKLWEKRDPKAMDKVKELLASHGVSMEAAVAGTFERRLEPLERIDRLITNTELRRNMALRELERHRAALARSLRRAAEEAEEAEEAEFQVIEPGRSET